MELINGDNVLWMNSFYYNSDRGFDIIYSDMIYENLNLEWLDLSWCLLNRNGVIIVQTDHHSVFEVGYRLKEYVDATPVNHMVWKNEWGNHPKDRFHQCFDDIIIFSKGKHRVFDSSVVQVPKATANTKLNPSGRMTKTATAWIDDICLTTTSKERVKKEDGHLIKWQKPLKLFDRIIRPFTFPGCKILDNFMGSGSLGVWCKQNNFDYTGIELDTDVYNLAKERINGS